MEREIKLLDVVALTSDKPEEGLVRGQVGTVVEDLSNGVVEVEFSDTKGITYASLAVAPCDLMILHHHPIEVA